MKKIKVIAKFIGGNSLGYITNNTYILLIDETKGMNVTRMHNEKESLVEYESLSAFLNNWDDIKHVKE